MLKNCVGVLPVTQNLAVRNVSEIRLNEKEWVKVEGERDENAMEIVGEMDERIPKFLM